MAKRLRILFFLLVSVHTASAAVKLDSILLRLERVMAARTVYETEKERQLLTMASYAHTPSLSPMERYEANLRLIKGYQKYRVDSAVAYIRKNRAIAASLQDPFVSSQAALQQARLYSTKGLYVEAKNLLDSIDRSALSSELLSFYFETYLFY